MNRRPRRGFGGSGLRITSPVSALILFNVAVFFAEAVFDRINGSGAFFGIFGLSLSALEHGRVWTLITYSFLHADILHILCNMVGLYYIGKYVERVAGARKFLALYFGGALAGAALWLGMSALGQTREVLVGASASVMAVFSAFCGMKLYFSSITEPGYTRNTPSLSGRTGSRLTKICISGFVFRR